VTVGVLRHRRPAAEVLPEVLVGAVVVVTERAGAVAELRQVAGLEQRITGVCRETTPEVGPEHRHHHRAVAPARLPLDPAMLTVWGGSVRVVDERHHLVAEVRQVVAGAARVEELAAAERRPAVHPDDDRGWGLAACEQLVGELGEVFAEWRAVPPHVELAGEALDDVDRRVAAFRLVVVARRRVDPQRPLVRVAERVPAELVADDRVLVEAALGIERPRIHPRPFVAL
jgi:hypothetical protein